MAIKLTATQFEALVLATEEPEPISIEVGASTLINPMLFPHDWSVECTLETRWLTDVTESVDQHQDRWILQSRPYRTLSARFLGCSKRESDAIINSMVAAATQFGFPVPIYPDAVAITEVPNATTIYGDFTKRRFFRGGRAVVMPASVDPMQSDIGSFFVRIDQVHPNSLVLSSDTLPFVRLPTTNDIIIPCMDVEMVPDATGTALTDSVYAAELTWNEVDGASSLPASWPAISADDASVLEPFCEIIDNKALFPFDPNWAEGVTISVRRPVQALPMGRTSVQDPSGTAYMNFEVSVMGYDRASCWNVVRVFDAMRGRAGQFWFQHPQSPWTLDSFLSTEDCRVAASSNQDTLAYIKRVIFERADGTHEIKEVSAYVEVGGSDLFQISWADSLPDTNFISVQPVYLCRFDQDTNTETWSTNEVIPSMSFNIIEDPTAGEEVSLISPLGYTEEYTSYTAIPDCDLLLRAGTKCFTSTGNVATPYPNVNREVAVWRDTSAPQDRQGIKARPVKEGTSTGGIITCPAMPIPSYRNNGQPFIKNPVFDLEYLTDDAIPIEDRQLWSATEGWTICFCITPLIRPTPNQSIGLCDFNSPEFGMTVAIDSPGHAAAARSRLIYQVLGTPAEIPFTVDLDDADTPLCITLRIGGSDNANTAHVWINGNPAIASGNTIALQDVTDYTSSLLYYGTYVGIADTATAIEAVWNNNLCANLVVSYKRALDINEIVDLHNIVASNFQAPMATATLF